MDPTAKFSRTMDTAIKFRAYMSQYNHEDNNVEEEEKDDTAVEDDADGDKNGSDSSTEEEEDDSEEEDYHESKYGSDIEKQDDEQFDAKHQRIRNGTTMVRYLLN